MNANFNNVSNNESNNTINRTALFRLAWRFVKQNGMTLSEALRTAWRNFKLRAAMRVGIVRFTFQKIGGEIRQAYGTLKESLLPPTKSSRPFNPTLQTYFDCEKQDWRCFKVANLLSIG